MSDDNSSGNDNENFDYADWGSIKIYEAGSADLVAYIKLDIQVSSFTITWKQCNTDYDAGKTIITNVQTIDYDYDSDYNHISYFTLVDEDLDKYIRAIITCDGYSGGLRSDPINPSSNVTRFLANDIYYSVAGHISTINSTVDNLNNNYSSTESIEINGSSSGTVTISNITKIHNVTVNWMGAYGPISVEYDYGFENFSNEPRLVILSGTGTYSYGGLYNDSKTYNFDYLTKEHLFNGDVSYKNSIGITYKANVQIRNYYRISTVSGYSYQTVTENNLVKVRFENGTEFTW
jgi:hypothetical protein